MWSTSRATVDSFAKQGAIRCVTGACAIISIIMTFCDANNTDTKASDLPWWCLLHYLVCAEAILMLEIVHQANSAGALDATSEDLLAQARRPMEWLSRVSATDLAAKRTYLQLSRLLNNVAAATGEQQDQHWQEYNDDDMIIDPIWLTPDMGLGVDPGGVAVYDHDMDSVPAAGYDHFSADDKMLANPWDGGEQRNPEGSEGPGGEQ
jgi:hypothetical protein